ncbi:nuclear factor 7, ovary-like [Mastacembelus armatus]|uniref:nuclear factor 7, ovary-like n=1 Tax=Mastacembelus armatus TaxID=205130 RepID=UPI000E45601D|nr:nuclear factor 7, ovary-like [Mastacembelus armatus]
MTKIKEDLWNTLEDLTHEQLKQFQWFLKQENILEGFSAIPEARLERADRQDTVDRMVEKYGCTAALQMSIRILEKISRNDLAERLSSNSLQVKDLRNHNSALLKCEYEAKKAELERTKAEIQLMIQERQIKICEIQHSAELSRKSAERQTKDSVCVFTLLLQSVKSSLEKLCEAIEEKQKVTQEQAEGFIKELEQEISELMKRSAEVERLSCTEDQLDFLKSFSSLKTAPPTKTWTAVSIPPPSYGQKVGSAVNQLKDKLNKDMEKLVAQAKLYRVQQFAADVTLDPHTANPYLILSDDGKQVYCGDKKQNLPDNPERFDPAINVLGKQSFSSGRFYFEVQVEGKISWDLGVVTESVNRKGRIEAKPQNGYWTICLRNRDRYKASGVILSVRPPPKTVGVFVDYIKREVSFFNVDSADIIHRFTDCCFTEKLYPFFSPGLHNDENPNPLIITPINYTD